MSEGTNTPIKSGQVLLSEPFMLDPNFKRSVVLIVDHTEEDGTVGFVLNKETDFELSELVEDIEDFPSKVFAGGPVATTTLHYLHNVGDMLEESVKIANGIYWGGDFTALKFLIDQKLILPENIRFFLGYSGWTAGQLSTELDERSWIISEMDPNYLFNNKIDELWKSMLKDKGEHFEAISQIDEDYIFN